MQVTGDLIQVPYDVEIYGLEETIFVLHENLLALLEYEMIGQAIFSTYML